MVKRLARHRINRVIEMKNLELISSLVSDLDNDEYQALQWKLLSAMDDLRDKEGNEKGASVLNQLSIALESIKESIAA